MRSRKNPVVFLCVVCLGFFIIAIIILTAVKWIAGKVSAQHPAETCLGQEQGFIYLTSETRMGGGSLPRTCPSSAEHCTSVCVANIPSLGTSLPGSSAPAWPSALLPWATGAEELLPKMHQAPLRERHSSPLPRAGRGAAGFGGDQWVRAPRPLSPDPSALLQRPECSQPHPRPLASQSTPRCLCELFCMHWASLPFSNTLN